MLPLASWWRWARAIRVKIVRDPKPLFPGAPSLSRGPCALFTAKGPTMGHPIVMGRRKPSNSIGKALGGTQERHNRPVTHNSDLHAATRIAIVVGSLDEAWKSRGKKAPQGIRA